MPIAHNIAALIDATIPSCIALRHRLHQIPELMYEEHQTAALIRQRLIDLSVPFSSGPDSAPTATIAHIGNPALPCVAFRADIDALPIQEQTGLPYQSTMPGQMHACGHDGHTAALLGVAAVLKQIESTLPVCIKLIWQPAEENGGGAGRLVDAGLLDGRIGPRPSAIFGLHGWPGLPVGLVSTRSGPIMASVDNFTATLTGRGAHGAFPHLSPDPIVAAADAVLSLQQIVSREIDPVEPAVITLGMLHAGTSVNVIPPTATLAGTVRAISPETRARIRHAVDRRLRGIALAQNVQLRLTWTDGYPPTINDPRMTDFLRETVLSTLGQNAFLPAAQPTMGGEDFAFYLQKISGCFFFLGLRPENVTDAPGIHHPLFDFNDQALPIAIRLFVGLALRFNA